MVMKSSATMSKGVSAAHPSAAPRWTARPVLATRGGDVAAITDRTLCCSSSAAQCSSTTPTAISSGLASGMMIVPCSRQAAHRRTAVVPQAAGEAQPPSSSSSEGDSHAGYAFLHDFCMMLPYGAIAIAAGIILVALGETGAGLPVGAAGVSVLGLAVLSLKSWKAHKSTAPFALLGALSASFGGYMSWLLVQAKRTLWLSWPLVALSSALAAFCLYNVIAGGNPPPRKQTPAA